MPVAERAATGVLPCQSHRTALQEQRPDGECLAHAPVDAVVGHHLRAALELGGQARMQREALGHADLRVDDALDGVPADPGEDVSGRSHGREGELPGAYDLVGSLAEVAPGQRRTAALEDRLELFLEVAQRLLGLLDSDVSAADERLGVVLAHRALRINELVHQRLRERGIVGLVVSAPAVGDEVDDDVLMEGLAELEGEACHSEDRLGIVAVDVEDRGLHHARHVGGVDARAAVARRGGEADLVVDDDVHGATGAVALQLGEVERLGHHSLAGKRGISVQEQRQDVERAIARELVLLRAHDALENRVDGFEMRGVGGDVHERLVPVDAAVGPARAQVVLHIAGALHGLVAVVALELGEDLRVGLAGDIGEDVEAATMRHADGDLDDVITRCGGEDLVEQRDE